jgi:quinoprotein glucose dehydrogenase
MLRPTISILLLLLSISPSEYQTQEWPFYGGDAGGSKYSPLKQINRQNVTQLKVAWTYHTCEISDGSTLPVRTAFECTPLVVEGILYLTTPFGRAVALEAETGRELWSFDPKLDKDRPYNLFISRGVSYWQSGRQSRIFLGTLDGRLFALDGRTGKPQPSSVSRIDRLAPVSPINFPIGFATSLPPVVSESRDCRFQRSGWRATRPAGGVRALTCGRETGLAIPHRGAPRRIRK